MRKIRPFAIEFAVIIRDLIGVKTSKTETMPAVEDDPQRRRPDISRAKKYLNWEPRVPLKVGLEKTIQYFRKELERSKHTNRNIFVPNRSTAKAAQPKEATPAKADIENVLTSAHDANRNGHL